MWPKMKKKIKWKKNQRDTDEYISFYWCTVNATFHNKQLAIVSIGTMANKYDYDLSR